MLANTQIRTHSHTAIYSEIQTHLSNKTLVQPPRHHPLALTSHVLLMAATTEVTVCK